MAAAAPSTGALQPPPASAAAAFSFQTPFTDLLRGVAFDDEDEGGGGGDATGRGGGSNVRRDGRPGGGVPRFKSAPPPSLPLSPPPVSPSSYFAIPAGLSPAELLDSPVLLAPSHILPSPTTGSFAAQWKLPQQQQQQPASETDKPANSKDDQTASYTDFSFPTSFNTQHQQQQWNNYQNELERKPSSDFPTHNNQTNNNTSNSVDSSSATAAVDVKPPPPPPQQQQQPQPAGNGGRSLDDGYNWRKYGQKQVKASENPRSYYKCTHPGCPTKKKVERSLVDGRITEIVYRGTHDHPKPQSTRRNSSSGAGYYSSSAAYQQQQQASSVDQQVESAVGTPENSSVSFEDTDPAGREEYDDVEPDAKRWKSEGGGGSDITSSDGGVPCSSGGVMNRGAPVREPRVVVQTTSDVDILDDGYRWRKYGQKVVKGNPNPRSYYKCTTVGCPVRKHVERACHDPRAVITTYEGKHNHDVPAARGSGVARQLQQQQQQQQGSDVASLMPLRPAAVAAGVYRGGLGQSNGGGFTGMLQHQHDADGDNNSNHSGGEFSSAGYGVDRNSHFFQQLLLAQQSAFQEAKEEPKDDAFLDSFLC